MAFTAALAPAAKKQWASLCDALEWRWDWFSTRGPSMNLRPVERWRSKRLRGCSRLTTFDSNGLGEHKPPCRCARRLPHATPAVVHKNIGPNGPRVMHSGENAADRLHLPRFPPFASRGAAPAEACRCPNAAQPELTIVSRLLLGVPGGNGKGRGGLSAGSRAPWTWARQRA